jgi:hypothetical protein
MVCASQKVLLFTFSVDISTPLQTCPAVVGLETNRGNLMKLHVLFLALPLVSGQMLSAQNVQNTDADGCNSVLVYTGRDYTLEERKWSTASTLYDSYCSAEHVKQGFSFDSGMDAVVEEIPFKGKLSGSNNNERMQSFCKQYNTEFAAFEKTHKEASIVVNNSVNAWLECKKLATRGVIFVPQVGQTQFTVGIKNLSPDEVKVKKILYDSKALSCVVDDSDQSPTSTEVTDKTTKKLASGSAYNSWNIACARKGEKKNDGSTMYPAFDFTVTTSKGNLLMPIAHDTAIPYQYASEIKTDIDGVNGRIKSQEDRQYTIAWDAPIPSNIGGDDADIVDVQIPGKHDICMVSETSIHAANPNATRDFNVISACKVNKSGDASWTYTVLHTKYANGSFPNGGTQTGCIVVCGTIK